jgi:hypothetical protein
VLLGRFGDISGRPYLEGRVVIPRLGLRGDFSLLVDTGADATFLMPGDAITLGLDFGLLRDLDTGSVGAGGAISSYREPAVVAFADDANLYGYLVNVSIMAFRDDMLTLPSLVGRDLLHRWRMTYHYSASRLEFEVESADVVVPLDGASIGPTSLPE